MILVVAGWGGVGKGWGGVESGVWRRDWGVGIRWRKYGVENWTWRVVWGFVGKALVIMLRGEGIAKGDGGGGVRNRTC